MVMKKDGRYRFTIQFPAHSESQLAVGELLEKMGNKKSSIIVDAVFIYLKEHPDLSAMYSYIAPQKCDPVPASEEDTLFLPRSSPAGQTAIQSRSALSDSVSSMFANLSIFG